MEDNVFKKIIKILGETENSKENIKLVLNAIKKNKQNNSKLKSAIFQIGEDKNSYTITYQYQGNESSHFNPLIKNTAIKINLENNTVKEVKL